jgi:predicted amidohydrolase
MQDLKIALVQADQHWEAKTANIANYESLLATIDGVDIILLPEMCTTAFTMNAGDLAEDFSNSSSLNWLKKLAESKNSAVFTSFTFMTSVNRLDLLEKTACLQLALLKKSFLFAAGTFSFRFVTICASLKSYVTEFQMASQPMTSFYTPLIGLLNDATIGTRC